MTEGKGPREGGGREGGQPGPSPTDTHTFGSRGKPDLTTISSVLEEEEELR